MYNKIKDFCKNFNGDAQDFAKGIQETYVSYYGKENVDVFNNNSDSEEIEIYEVKHTEAYNDRLASITIEGTNKFSINGWDCPFIAIDNNAKKIWSVKEQQFFNL